MLNKVINSPIAVAEEQIIEFPESEVPESEISVEISSEPLYCICQEPWDVDNRKFMIHCDHCSDWFHGACVGVNEQESKDIEKYHCPKCVSTVGPSVFLDISSRKTGKKMKKIRCTPEFIQKLKEYKFNIKRRKSNNTFEYYSPDEVVLKMRGQALTLPWLINKGFTRPTLIETTEALGIRLPPDTFTVNDVERYVGSDRMVDVIDVERQSDILMSMREFTEYFTSPNRAKILNLISLEFTHTNLNKLVDAPAVSRKLDWVANYWPNSQDAVDEDANQRPTVAKYCLISVKDSYTDFHIDFGGTSVWYHVLWGEKIFYLIEPSERNLQLYHRWMEGEMGDECFLADEVPVCFRCVLKKGQTMLIPTGWIHAVYTAEDSLVFGGNFLHFLNMDLQLQVYEMEKKLQTPSKYLFPSFEATHWFAAEGLIQDLQTLNATSFVPAYLIKGLKALIHALRVWVAEKDIGKVRREYIPAKLNCKKIIQELSKELRLSEKRLCPSSSKEGTTKEKDHSVGDGSVKPKLEASKRESVPLENGFTVGSSRESSPTHGNSKEPLKLLISRASSTGEVKCSPSSSPHSHVPSAPAPIKLKIKKQPSLAPSGDENPSTSPKEPRLKIRLSLTEGKTESIDCDSNPGSDALYIVESGDDLRIDTDASVMSSEDLMIDVSRSRDSSKNHRKHHHKKCRKSKSSKKHERDQNKAIDDVLAGTLNGMEELFQSSNYSERISQCENTSQAIKDTVAGMDAMKNTILPLKKRGGKHKKKSKEGAEVEESDDSDGIEKVHQDEDYIYLPLAGSDDESSTKKGKNKRGRKKEDDESWSPRVKVGPVGQRETKSSRVNAKRESVGKGLKKAAAMLETTKMKRKHREDDSEVKKVKKPKLVVPSPTNLLKMSSPTSSTTGIISWDSPPKIPKPPKKPTPSASSAPVAPKKPKKGMATPKQRLGKILKINKFTRF